MKQNTLTKSRSGVLKATKPTLNEEGFVAAKKSKKTELFLLGVGRFFGESTFYSDEAPRFVKLVRDVTKSDPQWVAGFASWLRNEANIRTAAIVTAAEYVKAGGPNGRAVVRSVIVRADEPAEMLAYWINSYGRTIPQPLKRGIADSATRLYTERNVSRWNVPGAVKMADVIELTHPRPQNDEQSALFKFVLDDRRGNGDLDVVPNIRQARACRTREDYLDALDNNNPCVSWENVSSAGKGSMTADQWSKVYSHMGYMAMLRNLRNLDKADVSRTVKRSIGSKLADADNVARSRQLPMRFYSAYKAVTDDVWRGYLDEALENSLANVPKLDGKWLVLVDASASMGWGTSNKSDLTYYDAATVFAAAFAKVNNADLYTYSSTLSPKMSVRGKSVLRLVEDLHGRNYNLMGGTATSASLKQAMSGRKYAGVLLLTDEQYNYGTQPGSVVPANVPLYTFNLVGYRGGHNTDMNRVTIGGLSDSAFTLMAAIESAKSKWPWE